MEEEELAALREKRLREKLAELQAAQAQEAQKKLALQHLCTPEAYARLANVRLANPELYESVVQLLLYLAQSRQLKGKVGDEQLHALLVRLTARKEGEIKVVRKRGAD
ncbi:MAG: DNA-binding protein [Candidatus Micrarchaeia archaeon]